MPRCKNTTKTDEVGSLFKKSYLLQHSHNLLPANLPSEQSRVVVFKQFKGFRWDVARMDLFHKKAMQHIVNH